jgi:hypothetical protein
MNEGIITLEDGWNDIMTNAIQPLQVIYNYLSLMVLQYRNTARIWLRYFTLLFCCVPT